MKDFSKEVRFKVGQRVDMDLPDIPKEKRDVTTGTIVKIDTHFPSTPEHRFIKCTVRLDGNYVKKEFRMAGGIEHDFACGQNRLTAI